MHYFLLVGIALFAGLMGGLFLKKIKLPQVIGYIVIGFLLGASGLKFLNAPQINSLNFITDLTLGLIGFLIGGELRWARIKKLGVSIFSIAIFESLFTAFFVFTAIYLFTKNLPLALLVGAISSSSAPGGTTDVIKEYRARGPVTTTIYGVIGVDDAIGIIIYALIFNFAKTFLHIGEATSFWHLTGFAIWEILGSILLGFVLSLIMMYLVHKIKDDDVTQLLALAAVFICSGIAIGMNFSMILANMALGVFLCNFRPHYTHRVFVLMNKWTPPIYILFFILVGARLDFSLLQGIGWLVLIYLLFRFLGKYIGSWFGGHVSGAPVKVKKYVGLCLLPQAGVAIGLAIASYNELAAFAVPEAVKVGGQVIAIITVTTFIFQVIGPLLTKKALDDAGEIKRRDF
ncbi:cation:proton antiporter [bacterium]|jgi:Kef-type K+ transport system membrane component KefB|nr:cation:proton antiporter [bacterium]MBT3581922.1 cation:proton antiporter [bacterium]MBT4551725.1 cation:proton antiporter [bacterium]MBT7088204.1 cation:proton antiporter [bacterium]